ncbi:MAG: biotin synthase BioB [Planctomycetota bacterium]|nr:biotin synthase BioB [Planctomycetota bacterium]
MPIHDAASPATDWNQLASEILSGHELTLEEGLSVLECPEDDLVDLLAATYRIRRRYWGNEVQLYTLKNAKSGLCPEDCGYCSQSKISNAAIPVYRMNDEATLLANAKAAADARSRTFCIVASGRGPTDREVDHVAGVVRKIKSQLPLNVCCCLGLLTPDQARKLADAGVDRVNHNVNTSRSHYDQICSTHTYEDRLETLRVVRDAGMEVCTGGIVGMGEKHADIVEMALELRELKAESIPVNFLHPIDGTPLGNQERLNPRFCLKVLCLFRLANPESEIRIAGGRELNLRWLQPQGMYAANSIFLADYLTTKGQSAEEDYKMIEDLGFTILAPGPETAKARAALAAT